jgi:hypothetical protein
VATATQYTYVGPNERIYSAYLAVAADGTTSTLIGTPGAEPVGIRKAGGADYDPDPDGRKKPPSLLPDIPGDDMWIRVDDKKPGDSKPATTTKAGA